MSRYDLAQTFFIDREAVLRAETVFITSVDLYFYSKPVEGKTKSGINKPGVQVAICPCKTDGSPIIGYTHHTFSDRVEYDNINVDTNGETVTTFSFRQPVPVVSDKSYAILIKFDGSDDDFKLWYNKAGEFVLGTTQVTHVNSGRVDGNFYKITNGFELTPETDADLAFRIKIANFTSTSTTFKTKNRSYEILKVTSIVNQFKGGETVYQQRANTTGNVSVSNTSTVISGNGTLFTSYITAGNKIVVTDGTTNNTDVLNVTAVTNTTHLIVENTPKFSCTVCGYYKTVTGNLFLADNVTDHIVIQDSTANSTVYLEANTVIRGVTSGASANISSIIGYAVNSVVPNYTVKLPAATTALATVNFANTGQELSVDRSLDVKLGKRTFINRYDPVQASRSSEVTAAVPFESFNGTLTFQTTNPYTSPYVREENLDLFLERYEINNDSDNEYNGRGNAKARYISKTVYLTTEQPSEDLKVFVRAFAPSGTSVKVYAKFRNSEDNESLDLKDWTELYNNTPQNVSNPANIFDRVELEYSVPFITSTTAGTITIDNAFKTTLNDEQIVARSAYLIPSTFNANTGVNGTTDYIQTSSAHNYANGTLVTYVVSSGNTVLPGLSNGSSYYVVGVANTTHLQLSTTSGGSAVNVTATTTSETGHTLVPEKSIEVGSVLRVYSPIIPANYFTDIVTTVSNTTVFEFASPVANASVVGDGFRIEKIKRPNSAFLNIQEENVLTYFNRSGSKFKTFDSFAIKIVLLSQDSIRVPYVDDVRAIAVSA